MSDPDALTPREFLEVVAGHRCPCGHERALHADDAGLVDDS